MLNRGKMLRIGRILTTTFALSPRVTVFDDSGFHCHFNVTVQHQKLTYLFSGPWSYRAQQALKNAFPKDLITVEEARAGKRVIMPLLHGIIENTSKGIVLVWCIDPVTFTLTVRERRMNNPWISEKDEAPLLEAYDPSHNSE